MACNVPPPFKKISWYRLTVTLLGKKPSTVMKSHAVSVIQAIIKAVSSNCKPFASLESENLPVFHMKNKKHTFKMKPFDQIPVEIFFFKNSLGDAIQWKECLANYLADEKNSRTFELFNMGEVEERNFNVLSSELNIEQTEGEICLEFLIPLPFKREKGKNRSYISKTHFIQRFEKRFSRLFGKEFKYECSKDNFSILPYYWNYTEIIHQSKSQPGKTQYVNGWVGKFYIKGKFRDFLPFIILGSELHTGTKLSNSQGYYRIHKESVPYFRKIFPTKKGTLSVIRDVIERYDQALESLSQDEMYPFEEQAYAEELCDEIIKGEYIPSQNTAFIVKCKNRRDRLVEQLSFKDLIISQYLLITVSKIFDTFFEEESIGFRKGISRKKAVGMVESAIIEGFTYVIESDIEDFFPSVDLTVLKNLIDFYLPEKDICLKNLLKKIIENGYILNGKYCERLKGLALGNPLSPILSNIYLDSFDEQIKKLDVKLIRYADDFIILCRSLKDAENLLSKTSTFLSEIGLRIKKEKTAIKPIKNGFQFLGITFDGKKETDITNYGLKLFKKPLYITEPYVFLSLNGDAINIKKDKRIIETIPIRRISEVMVMEKTVFSTGLIRKCVENNIPFTVSLNTGYYITTIKPDSKKYYDISYEHSKKFYSLSETELLCIAKEFAAGKINNYISFFKQKYIKGQNILLNELYGSVSRISQSGDIHEIRGIEGITARKIYEKLNNHIENTRFHIERRNRRNPDRINSLLNFGFYLLFSRINATVRGVGLNPYLGFLHSPKNNYESLVCDVEELFRSRIVRFIVRLINLKIITEDDFVESERGFYLNRDGVAKYLSHFEAEMNKKGTSTSLSLKQHIYAQVSNIKNWILENKSLSFYNWKV